MCRVDQMACGMSHLPASAHGLISIYNSRVPVTLDTAAAKKGG